MISKVALDFYIQTGTEGGAWKNMGRKVLNVDMDVMEVNPVPLCCQHQVAKENKTCCLVIYYRSKGNGSDDRDQVILKDNSEILHFLLQSSVLIQNR